MACILANTIQSRVKNLNFESVWMNIANKYGRLSEGFFLHLRVYNFQVVDNLITVFILHCWDEPELIASHKVCILHVCVQMFPVILMS